MDRIYVGTYSFALREKSTAQGVLVSQDEPKKWSDNVEELILEAIHVVIYDKEYVDAQSRLDAISRLYLPR